MTWPGHCLPWALQRPLESRSAACSLFNLTISKNFTYLRILVNTPEQLSDF